MEDPRIIFVKGYKNSQTIVIGDPHINKIVEVLTSWYETVSKKKKTEKYVEPL